MNGEGLYIGLDFNVKELGFNCFYEVLVVE